MDRDRQVCSRHPLRIPRGRGAESGTIAEPLARRLLISKSMNFVGHVQYAATAALLGLTLLAPPASSADPAPVVAHRQQGLRWPVQGKVISRFGSRRLFHLHRGVDI